MVDTKDENQPPPLNIAPLKPAGRQIAVALQGNIGSKQDGRPDSLPKVIASGYGRLAEQILEMAHSKGIKVRADADLAELLATLDLDTPIPSEAIIAVAEIMAKMYEANARFATTPEGQI
jgi:flagellar biosynthesis protein